MTSQRSPTAVCHAFTARTTLATEQHRPGAERQGFQHVGRMANPAVEQHGQRALHGVHHARQCLQRGLRTIHLSSAVVGDDDAVHTGCQRLAGVVDMQDALE